jgi:hypothetical protein
MDSGDERSVTKLFAMVISTDSSTSDGTRSCVACARYVSTWVTSVRGGKDGEAGYGSAYPKCVRPGERNHTFLVRLQITLQERIKVEEK